MQFGATKLSLQLETTDWHFANKFLLLANNAFRFLSLPASASQTQINNASDSLIRAFKLDSVRNKETDLAWLGKVQRNENRLREALSRLANPQQRLKERLFWFHQTLNISAPKSAAELETETQKLLSSGEVTAKHSAALLSLATCYSFDSEINYGKTWLHSLALWNEVAEDDEFWRYFLSLDLKGSFEQAATPAEIERLRRQTLELVLEQIAELARKPLRNNKLTLAQKIFDAVHNANLPERDIDFFENTTLGEFEEKYFELCRQQFDAKWIEPVKIRNTVLPNLKAICLLGGARSKITKRLFVLTAADFFEIAKSNQWKLELFTAWILAPPESGIYIEIKNYVNDNKIRIKIPFVNSDEMHYHLVMKEMESNAPSLKIEDSRNKLIDSVPTFSEHFFACVLVLIFLLWFFGFIELGRTDYTINRNSNSAITTNQVDFGKLLNQSTFWSYISAAELRDLRRKRGLVIVNVSSKEQHDEGHIPGAVLYSEGMVNNLVRDLKKHVSP